MTTRQTLVLSLAAAVGFFAAGLAATSEAGLLAKNEAKAKIAATKASLAVRASAADPTCCAPAPVPCCPKPCITYKHHCTLRKTCCDCCTPPKNIVLHVVDPCTCCKYDIPICVPGCCCGEPSVCEKGGVLGRSVVVYDWCCGYKVKVIFDRCGDITVHSFGR